MKEWQVERFRRCDKANALLKFIGDHGRHFFREDCDRPVQKDFYHYDYIDADDAGRLWFVPVRGKREIYLHVRTIELPGQGGTLTALIAALKNYIMTGDRVRGHLGPFPSWACQGDPWGYGEDMVKVRQKAIELGIYE